MNWRVLFVEGRTTQPLNLYLLTRACELFGALIFLPALPSWRPWTWFALVSLAGTWGTWRVTRPDFKQLPPERRRKIYRHYLWQSTAMVGSACYFLYVPGDLVMHSLLGIYLVAAAVIVAMWGVRDIQRTAVSVCLVLMPSTIRMCVEGIAYERWTTFLLGITGVIFALMIVYTAKLYATRIATEHVMRLQAERASEAMANVIITKSRFFASVSHDLRQPVHAIGLYLDPLIRSLGALPDPLIRRSLEGIQESWRALDDLLSQVLDLTRLDAGSVLPTIEVVNLDVLVRSLILQHSAAAEKVGVRLIALSKPDHAVLADELMLKRVVSNLLDNAIKFSAFGQSVVLTSRPSGENWCLQVRDAGPGIPEHAQDTIFEEFVQIGNEGRDRQNGYGLGLAIARRFVTLMKGSIQVRSRLGHGCCMNILLPKASIPEVAFNTEDLPSEMSNTHLPMKAARTPSITTHKLLLVEDDLLVADAMTQILSAWGQEVLHVTTAAEAMTQSEYGDIAICDIRLPEGESGLDLALRLRDNGKKVMLLTGETGNAIREKAKAHSLRLLRKPLSAEELAEAIEQVEREEG